MTGELQHSAESLGDFVRRLVSRIFSKIKVVAPVVLAIGCQGPRPDRAEKKAPIRVAAAIVAPKSESASRDETKPLGSFDITFYYVIGEDEAAKLGVRKRKKPANDNKAEVAKLDVSEPDLAAVTPAPELVTLYEPKSCGVIADVSAEFASQLELQGTGKLRDGRVLNIWGGCPCERKPCFKVTENQWGTSGSGRPLQPFRTVAVDRKVIKLGTLLYVPLLEGRTMPGRAPWGGYVHDGCVVADDTGGGIDGNQLDLFVGRKAYFLGLSGTRGSHAWARHVPVFDGSKVCERKGRKVGRRSAAI